MIRPGIYQKIYFISAFILMAFISLGYMMSTIIRDYAFPGFRNPQAPFFARLVDEVNQDRREEALSQIQNWAGATLPFDLVLVNDLGESIYPIGISIPWRPSWSAIKKPDEDFESVSIEMGTSTTLPNRPTLVKFPGTPSQYLYVYSDRPRRPGTPPRLVYWTMGGVVISILIGIAVSIVFLSRQLRTKIVLADSVLAELQKGNLKARFPIKNKDEIGQAMIRFNNMADEIERLVEQIQSADNSRRMLLQELTHDLRTPIASMKNLLETLNSGKMISDQVRLELTSLATKEVHYFERLIEDLLVLAQVSDPKYLLAHEHFNINDFIRDEAENMASQSPQSIRLTIELTSTALTMTGDLHLIKRLVRNAIDNAYFFAKSEVTIKLDQFENRWARIVIQDDGPGFDAMSLEAFGHRRRSRILDPKPEGKLSVGLGSVIMKNIAHLHRGSVKPGNQYKGNQILGATVTILLPISWS